MRAPGDISILQRNAEILKSANPEVLDAVSNLRRDVREQAIETLTSALDTNSTEDILVFNTLPFEFVREWNTLGAIWYIETIGSMGNELPWEVIEKVCNQALIEKREYILSEDVFSAKIFSRALNALFRMLKNHPKYKETSSLHMLLGNFREKEDDSYGAISFYNRVIECGCIEGFIAAATAYNHMKKYDASLLILENGYSIYRDSTILEKLIHTLCMAGRADEAVPRYKELVSKKGDKIPPFLTYKKTIETDSDLGMFESMLVQYFADGKLVPSETFHALSISASEYIESSLLRDKRTLQTIHAQSLQEHTSQHAEILKRKLYLMQVDILILGNDRYLDSYLSEIEQLGIQWDDFSQGILGDYFVKRSPKGTEPEVIDSLGFFGDISEHLEDIWELFSTGSFYELQKETIIPLVRKSIEIQEGYDDVLEGYLSSTLAGIKIWHDYFYSLREDVQKSYEDFMRQFDGKYGMFYRREIQRLALDLDLLPEDIPSALGEYPEIALLFWMEKILSKQFHTQDPDEICEIVDTYQLWDIRISWALLFGTLLYDISPAYSLEYLAGYPRMLTVPQAIYIITECLRKMTDASKASTLQRLDALVVQEYGGEDLFEHIEYTFKSISGSKPNKEVLQYMLLTRGNIPLLHEGTTSDPLENFYMATQNNSIEWLMQMGDFHEEKGHYSEALYYFKRAFSEEMTIFTTSRLLRCTLSAGDFEQAQKYIDFALRQGYDIGSYIIAFHIRQGNVKIALREALRIIQSGKEIVDIPKGTTRRLFAAISFLLNTGDMPEEDRDEITIFGSHLLACTDYDSPLPDMTKILDHWQYVTALCDTYEGDMLHEKIRQLIEPLLKTSDLHPYASVLSWAEVSSDLLQSHAENFDEFFIKTSERVRKHKNTTEIGVYLDTLRKEFVTLVILLLQRFPDTETSLNTWRAKLRFTGVMNPLQCDMPTTIQ